MLILWQSDDWRDHVSKPYSRVCVSLCTTVVHNTLQNNWTTLIIFPRILQTIIVALMMSTGGEGIFPEELTTMVQHNVDDYISKVRINTQMTFFIYLVSNTS